MALGKELKAEGNNSRAAGVPCWVSGGGAHGHRPHGAGLHRLGAHGSLHDFDGTAVGFDQAGAGVGKR